MKLENLKKRAERDLEKAKNLKELQELYKKYLGKKGELTLILRSLKELPEKERVKTGKEANNLKISLAEKLQAKASYLHAKEIRAKEEGEWLDISVPGKRPSLGHLHPLTKVWRRVEEIFANMGFSVVEGPEIETEWYNFDALNIPPEHPARDLWDTFWLRQNGNDNDNDDDDDNDDGKAEKLKVSSVRGGKLLLRTHTSPVQVRYMEKHNPPLRIIVPGRVFRHEATDSSHDFQLFQVEGLMVDKEVTVANFKAIIQQFFQQFFRKSVSIRLRPSFFPFTEPSFEVDMLCQNCQGKGCSVCGQTGWLEMLGAGMVHPAVFKAAGYNPKNWQGFAFGMGLDRLTMMKYKIDDIRLLYSGDLRFLKQF